MSTDNELYLNISLVLIASIVDALWYVFFGNLVTSGGIIEFIKKKSAYPKDNWIYFYSNINNFINRFN